LKQALKSKRMGWLSVAPRAGAWIETRKSGRKSRWVYVAPRAGAWIET